MEYYTIKVNYWKDNYLSFSSFLRFEEINTIHPHIVTIAVQTARRFCLHLFGFCASGISWSSIITSSFGVSVFDGVPGTSGASGLSGVSGTSGVVGTSGSSISAIIIGLST